MTKNLRKQFSILYTVFLLFHISIKSFSNTITTDEAYSFLEYVYTANIFNIGLANNHLLNTLLMYFTTRFGIQEIFLRLPNLFFGAIYIITSYLISKKFKDPIYGLILLTACPYLLDYFTLARGYGISATFIYLGCVFYYLFDDLKYNFLIANCCFILAALSIHIYLIFLGLFFIFNIKKELIKNRKSSLISLILVIFFSRHLAIWTFQISASGKPLFGANEVDFIYLLRTYFGFMELYAVKIELIYFPLLLIFLLPYFFVNKNSNKIKNLFLVTNLSIASLIILPIIFQRPFPAQRILIPLVPALLLLNVLILDPIFQENGRLVFISKQILVILLLINVNSNLSNSSTLDWGPGMNKEDLQCKDETKRIREAEYYKLLLNEENISFCNN